MIKSAAPSPLESFHDKGGADIREVHFADQAFVNFIVMAHVPGYDPQQVVDVAARAVELKNFRDRFDRVLEARKPRVAVLVRADKRIDRQPETERLLVKHGNASLDDAFVLEFTYAPPDRRFRQGRAVGELAHREARIGLQQAQDFKVFLVHSFRNIPLGGTFVLSFR